MKQTNKEINKISKKVTTISINKANYENVSLGLALWLNTTKDTKREYACLVYNKGNKFYLNKVKVEA